MPNYNLFDTDQLILILVSANWYSDCEDLKDYLKSLCEQFEGMKLIKIEIDQIDKLPFYFKASTIPNIIICRNKKVLGEIKGIIEQDTIKNKLQSYLSNTLR